MLGIKERTFAAERARRAAWKKWYLSHTLKIM